MKCVILAALVAAAMAAPRPHGPPVPMAPQPTDPLPLITPLPNSPLNHSLTNTVLPMTTPEPTTRRLRAKMLVATFKVHTVSTFPTVAFKLSPTPLTTPTVSLLMSSMKVSPCTQRRNHMHPPQNTPQLPPSTLPLKLIYRPLSITTELLAHKPKT